jgi:hypothetical protein
MEAQPAAPGERCQMLGIPASDLPLLLEKPAIF